MRLQYVVLLAIAYIAASAAVPAVPNLDTPDVASTQIVAPPTRFRRMDTTTTSDDEERTVKISALDKLKNLVETVSFKVKLLRANTIEEVLKHNIGDLTNGKLKMLQERISVFNLQHPEKQTTLLAALTNRYGDVELAMMLQPLRSGAADDVATKLHKEMFTAWKASGSPLDKAAVVARENPLLSREIDALRREFQNFKP